MQFSKTERLNRCRMEWFSEELTIFETMKDAVKKITDNRIETEMSLDTILFKHDVCVIDTYTHIEKENPRDIVINENLSKNEASDVKYWTKKK